MDLITRRDVLKLGVAGAAGLVLPQIANAATPPAPVAEPDPYRLTLTGSDGVVLTASEFWFMTRKEYVHYTRDGYPARKAFEWQTRYLLGVHDLPHAFKAWRAALQQQGPLVSTGCTIHVLLHDVEGRLEDIQKLRRCPAEGSGISMAVTDTNGNRGRLSRVWYAMVGSVWPLANADKAQLGGLLLNVDHIDVAPCSWHYCPVRRGWVS